ncbi:MAG TPA: glycoside hydrolase family 5 protein, partial [Pyrinomonadaceae bacterium]|nr:glycoside hydrolase family 5 protein [Pyrinomonadaceae bacterium]
VFLLFTLVTLHAAVSPPSFAQRAQRKSGLRAPKGVSPERLATLRRGINLSHWFAQANEYTPEHLASHTTPSDLALIKSAGFDHVRLSVEPAPLIDTDAPDGLSPSYLEQLDGAIREIHSQGLAVIVDVHPSSEFKRGLAASDAAVEAFVRFWAALAKHLSRYDERRLFLELLNEPEFEDGSSWIEVQGRLAAAVREAAPRHTIIATAHRWSAVEQLKFLMPLADKNVVYAFHFYEPHNFTHQGATWGADYWPHLRNVPYPSSPASVAYLLPGIADETARRNLAAYGEERWDAARVGREMERAVRWARKNRVSVICNEFGVYRKFSPPAARARWLRDVRRALERRGIGWAMWDYAGGFGVAVKEQGTARLDPVTLEALGLGRTKTLKVSHGK